MARWTADERRTRLYWLSWVLIHEGQSIVSSWREVDSKDLQVPVMLSLRQDCCWAATVCMYTPRRRIMAAFLVS